MQFNTLRETTISTLRHTEKLFGTESTSIIDKLKNLPNLAPQLLNKIKQAAFEKRRKAELNEEQRLEFNSFLVNTMRKLNEMGIVIDFEHNRKIFKLLGTVYKDGYLDVTTDFDFIEDVDDLIEEPEFEFVNGSIEPGIYPDSFEHEQTSEVVDRFLNLEKINSNDRVVVIAKGSRGETIMESGVVSNVISRPLKGSLTSYRINFEGTSKYIEIYPNTEAMIWYSAISKEEIFYAIDKGSLEQ